jgi:NitT/TauT family transport system permease protein
MSTATTTTLSGEQARARRLPRLANRLLLYQVLFAILVFGFWQFASGRLIDAFWVSSPVAIAVYLWEGFSTGRLIQHGAVTFYEAGLGFVLGALAGILTGLVLAVAETPRRILDPYFMAVYGMPRVALAPLFIIWFGIGTLSKVVLVFMIVFLLVFFSTYQGVINVPAELKRLVRVLGASERQVWTKVILPSASPWIITGLKISVPQALVGAVVGEFIASSQGLGFIIQYHSGLFQTTGVMGGIAIMAVAVVIINDLLDRLERRLMRWRPKEQASVASEP